MSKVSGKTHTKNEENVLLVSRMRPPYPFCVGSQ